MKSYVKLNDESIVISTLTTSKEIKGEEWIEVDTSDDKMGLKFDGEKFIKVEKEEKEEKIVTNEQLDEKLDKIISLLQKKEEKE